MTEHTKVEEQVICVLLTDKESTKNWANSQFGKMYFDEIHHPILAAISYADAQEVRLTRTSFKEFLSQYKKLTPAEIAAQTTVFNRCLLHCTSPDDLPILLEKVKIAYIRRQSAQYIREYGKEREKTGDIGANRALAENLLALENNVTENKAEFTELGKSKDDYINDLKFRNKNPESRIKTDIREIDYTMTKGLAPGHLTLFCAAPGGYKTTMMVNIAINLFKKGVNVLYVPVEMKSREIMHKIVARETQIDLYKLDQAEHLTEDDIKRAENELVKWQGENSTFGLLKMKERTRVAEIRHEIEKRMNYFKPQVVFIDYVDNLIPEKFRAGRNDLEMNEILEDLRQMGDVLGFSIVSAAQLARDALKRLKESKDGKQNPFDSSDIRGGQVYTANADNVYGQLKDPDDPIKLIITCIKSRHGPSTFRNDAQRACLAVKPNIALVESEPDDATDFRSKEGQEYVGMIATPPPLVEEEGSPF